VLCRDTNDRSVASSEGINGIVVMDDSLLWTVSGGNSSIKRWQLPKRRAARVTAPSQDMDSSLCESPVQSRKQIVDPSSSPTLARHDTFSSLSAPTNNSNRPSRVRLDSTTPSVTPSVASENWGHREKDKEGSAAVTTTLYGIPYDSLVRLASPNDPFTPYLSMSRVRDRDPEVATLYSTASVMSVPRTSTVRPPLHSVMQQTPQRTNTGTSPKRGAATGSDTLISARWGSGEEQAQPVNTARMEYEERDVAADAVPLYSSPEETIAGDHGLVRSIILNDRIHALTVDTLGEVAVWELVRGICLGRYSPEDIAQANHGGSANGGSERDGKDRERSAREALEVVRERIEGEAVVLPWSLVDTKTGVLTVHITERCFEAEIYADEGGFGPDKHFSDEARRKSVSHNCLLLLITSCLVNIGRWVLRNLFIGFLREEQRTRRNRDNPSGDTTSQPHTLHRVGSLHRSDSGANSRSSSTKSSISRNPGSPMVISSSTMIPAVMPDILITSKASPQTTPMISLHPILKDMQSLSPIPQSPASMPPRHLRSHTSDDGSLSANKDPEYSNTGRTRQASVSSPGATEERLPSLGPGSPGGGGGLMGRWKSFSKNAMKKTNDSTSNPPPSGRGSNSSGRPSVGDVRLILFILKICDLNLTCIG
jgi:WD repeat-containing protein 48